MTVQNAKTLAHELTMEFIKNRGTLNDPALSNIPEMVEKFADINNRFYEAVINNEKLNKLYQ